MAEVTKEASPDFYSKDYFYRAEGSELFLQTQGSALGHYRARVFELAGLQPGERVLDLGCGRGEVLLAALQIGCEVWGLDFSPDAIQLSLATVRANAPATEERLHLIACDAAEIDFEPDYLDCVITSDFVEHILPERLGLIVARIHHSLKPGGRFIIHTSPSIGYMYVGQYIARLMEVVKGETAQPLVTFDWELRYGGHCNIQSIRSLRSLLKEFSRSSVWAEFSLDEGMTKSLLNSFRVTPLLAHHLYAIGHK